MKETLAGLSALLSTGWTVRRRWGLMEQRVLDAMNRGLRDLEPHPLLEEPASPQALARFEAHALVFAEAFGRRLERRVARNIDREIPSLSAVARFHLRLHQPFARGLRADLVRLGRPHAQLESFDIGPRARRCLLRADRALDKGDPLLVHALLVQGLECILQLIARRGVELAQALGGAVQPFEARHQGHEDLFFMGINSLAEAGPERQQALLDELRELFGEARPLFDEWRETDPSIRPTERPRRRPTSRRGTADLPDGVA